VIVVCNEGYTSSLAAAALQELGVWRATDIVGGYRAWRAAGLPTLASDAYFGGPGENLPTVIGTHAEPLHTSTQLST
jgi:hypothetical protein